LKTTEKTMTLTVHDMNIQGNDSIQKELLQKESEIEIARKLSFSGAVDPVVSKIDDKVQVCICIKYKDFISFLSIHTRHLDCDSYSSSSIQ
jgi:hypothetical protein